MSAVLDITLALIRNGIEIPALVNQSDEANRKKAKLLEMARNGKSRPISRSHIGCVLCDYTNASRESYDPDFDKLIREIRPDWFINTADEKKAEFLKMARAGKPKPVWNDKLGMSLYGYTSEKNECYDADFAKKIRTLRPDWFVSQCLSKLRATANNKATLIEMAKSGKPRPKFRSKTGNRLSSYTRKISKRYDSDFDKQIRKTRPDWFDFGRYESASRNKAKLLEMAKAGLSRPHWKHIMAKRLSRYTSELNTAYDIGFDREIRKLRPDWFFYPDKSANKKKAKLLKIARNGLSRPSCKKDRLGGCLVNYTCKRNSAYDSDFDERIRKLRPDWFRAA